MAAGRALDETAAVSALLKEMRTEAQIRQTDLADTLNVPQSFISKYESAERRLDVIEVRQICHALGFSLAEFARRLELRLKGAQK